MNILILAGGLSPERDVSLSSASKIACALQKKGHAVCLADVYEGIIKPNNATADISGKDGLDLFCTDAEYSYVIPKEPPSLEDIRKRNGYRSSLIAPSVLELCSLADVVYIGLHGDMGENGQLQATLDTLGIKYTGSGYIGSALAMDKDLSKRVMSFDGILTAPWVRLTLADNEASITAVESEIGYPCVIKPIDCGSSVGVSFAYDRSELQSALEGAARYGRFAIAEKMIFGRELSIGILDGTPLPPVEIIPLSGFYDYENKYQSGMTTELCPAPLTADELSKLEDAAKRVFSSLRLEGYGRIDFILSSDGNFYCLEANTLPGMTPASLLPLEAATIGLSYEDLCDKIATLACNKA